MKKRKIINRLVLVVLLLIICAADSSAQIKTPPKPAEKPLPNLSLSTIGGEQWNLDEQRGKIVLLNFWATWCAPCRTEIPSLVRLSSKYKASGLEIVGIAVDSENIEQINRFISDYKINYPVLLTVSGSLLSKQKSVPLTLLVNEKGFLAKKYVGAVKETVIEKDIKNLLNKKSVGAKNALP